MEKLKTSILAHIRKGDAQKVFDLLNTHIIPFSYTDNLVTVLQASYNRLGKDIILGKINSEESSLRFNSIFSSLMDLCKLIQKEDLILRDDPDLSEKHIAYFLIQRAEKYRKNRDYQNAIKDLVEAAQQQPKNIAIQNDLAMSYRLIGNYKEAINIFDNIKDKRPNDVLSLNELATCQRELDRYNAALETLDRGLKLQPDNNHFHSNKFFIHLFFTLDKNQALAVRDAYQQAYGKNLILKLDLHHLYNQFLEHFDGIHTLSVDEILIKNYISECEKKRAFKTAQSLLDKGLRKK